MNKNAASAVLFGVLATAGTVSILLLYSWARPPEARPFDPGLVVAVGGAAADLLAALLIVWAAGGIGRGVLGRGMPQSLSLAERVGIEGLIGLGVLNLVALVMGLAGVFRPLVLWGVLAAVLVVGGGWSTAWARAWGTLAREAWRTIRSPWARLLAGMVAFWVVSALVVALLPPTQWDALMYHLVGPQRLLRSGQMISEADNHYLGLSQGAEIIYGWGMGLLGRDTVPAVLHALFGGLGLIIVAGIVERHTDSVTAWLSAVILLSAGGFWLSMTRPYVDLAVFGYSAAVLALLTVDDGLPTVGRLIVLGGCAGLAVSVKYTAGLLAVALGVVLIVRYPRQVIHNGLIAGGAAVIAYGLWGVRGWMLYENPVYPFFFGGVGWDSFRTELFGSAGNGLLSGENAWHLLVLPITATIFGVEGAGVYSFDAGPWLFTLWLLVPVGWRRLDDRARHLVRTAALLALPMLVVWVISGASSGIGAQIRLMIPIFPMAAVLGAVGLQGMTKWGRKPIDFYFVVRALVIVSLGFGVLTTTRQLIGVRPLDVLLGAEPRSDYRARRLGAHQEAMVRVGDLPEGSRVLFLWEPKGYLCPRLVTCNADTLTDHWLHMRVVEAQPAAAIFGEWAAEYDYLLVWRRGLQFYLEESSPPFTDYRSTLVEFAPALDAYGELVWESADGTYGLYTIDRS